MLNILQYKVWSNFYYCIITALWWQLEVPVTGQPCTRITGVKMKRTGCMLKIPPEWVTLQARREVKVPSPSLFCQAMEKTHFTFPALCISFLSRLANPVSAETSSIPVTVSTGAITRISRVISHPYIKEMMMDNPMVEMFCAITPSLEPTACNQVKYEHYYLLMSLKQSHSTCIIASTSGRNSKIPRTFQRSLLLWLQLSWQKWIVQSRNFTALF